MRERRQKKYWSEQSRRSLEYILTNIAETEEGVVLLSVHGEQ